MGSGTANQLLEAVSFLVHFCASAVLSAMLWLDNSLTRVLLTAWCFNTSVKVTCCEKCFLLSTTLLLVRQ